MKCAFVILGGLVCFSKMYRADRKAGCRHLKQPLQMGATKSKITSHFEHFNILRHNFRDMGMDFI